MSKKAKVLLTVGFIIAITMLTAVFASAAGDVSAGVVTGGSVNVRSAPSLNGKIQGQLTKNTNVVILEKDGDWYKISYNSGTIGYMSAQYIKKVNATAADLGYAVLLGETPLYFDTDAYYGWHAVLGEGSWVKITGIENGMFKAKTDKFEGYLPSGCLELVKPTSEIIAACAGYDPGRMIVETAKLYLGVRYVAGGSSPSVGFDCSGFVYYVFQQSIGFTFQQKTRMYLDGVNVKREDLLPGDVVFFWTKVKNQVSHVGIYIGDGKFMHSPQPGKTVTISDLYSVYYAPRFYTARRIDASSLTFN